MKKLLLLLMVVMQLNAENIVDSFGFEFVKIPSGSFMMGRDASVEKGGYDEVPRRKVHVESFAMQTTEVTQSQWIKVMKSNPSFFKDKNRPVEQVSWHDAEEFIKKLNQLAGADIYRLPTEAEWEYAARAGSQTTYIFGNDRSQLDSYAWTIANSEKTTHLVAQKKPNKWGLYDITGNVWEWCQDWYNNSYKNVPSDGSANTKGEQKYRVLRGGGWNGRGYLRVAFRSFSDPDFRGDEIGFRLVRTLP